MVQVMIVARMLAMALGLDFGSQWECKVYDSRPAYVCEYVTAGWFAEVWSYDGSNIYVNIDVN